MCMVDSSTLNDAATNATDAAAKANSAATSANEAVEKLGDADTAKKAAEAARDAAKTSESNAATSESNAAASATTAQTAAESASASETNVDAMVDTIAKEPTAQEMLAIMQESLALLKQIIEDGTGGDLNGFMFNRGESGEVILTYTNPDDETDTATVTLATRTTGEEIATVLAEINESLHTIAGTEATA